MDEAASKGACKQLNFASPQVLRQPDDGSRNFMRCLFYALSILCVVYALAYSRLMGDAVAYQRCKGRWVWH